jgi:prephenate dehydrogenase
MHLSYALQWIFFAVVGFGLLGWSIRRDLRDAGDAAVLAADERARQRRTGRAPTDEAAEDALLDR